jgi:leukotriene-A4 hydrolase
VSHLEWEVRVDFDEQRLHCKATYHVDRIVATAPLQMDTSALEIIGVITNDGTELDFCLKDSHQPHLGQQLSITLTPQTDHGTTTSTISVFYATTKACTAIQWLPPAQTAGRLYPYLFTQCQAIHARSLVPCQDAPSAKFTYTATVTVPEWATCVMSALQTKCEAGNGATTFVWHQAVPISSYLLAMAVGQLEKRDISDRVCVWSEPALVDLAKYEFEQTEDYLQIAENIAGIPYVWGRYDLLCMPPSFPYGGMENPNLTFVTPTLLAGDRSLSDVVAHGTVSLVLIW